MSTGVSDWQRCLDEHLYPDDDDQHHPDAQVVMDMCLFDHCLAVILWCHLCLGSSQDLVTVHTDQGHLDVQQKEGRQVLRGYDTY
jgi:hypothetical protein